MSGNIHVHRLRVAWERTAWPHNALVTVRADDIKAVLDRLKELTQAIEDFQPTHVDDEAWRDDMLEEQWL